jgi:hypothetical protein
MMIGKELLIILLPFLEDDLVAEGFISLSATHLPAITRHTDTRRRAFSLWLLFACTALAWLGVIAAGLFAVYLFR